MHTVEWNIHLKSPPEDVFKYLITAKGRKEFWAESAVEKNGKIHFHFPNGEEYLSKILYVKENQEFHLDYFDSTVKFLLHPDEKGGTDLNLTNEGVSEEEYSEVLAGWVSVLLNLKAVVDYHCDLRNHDPERTWNQKYADN